MSDLILTPLHRKMLSAGVFCFDGWTKPEHVEAAKELGRAGYVTGEDVGSDTQQYTRIHNQGRRRRRLLPGHCLRNKRYRYAAPQISLTYQWKERGKWQTVIWWSEWLGRCLRYSLEVQMMRLDQLRLWSVTSYGDMPAPPYRL